MKLAPTPSVPATSLRSIARFCAGLLLAFPLAASARGAVNEELNEAPAELAALAAHTVAERGLDAVWQIGTPFPDVEAAWQAPNRARDLRSYFTASGVRVVPFSHSAWELWIELAAFGRAGDLSPAQPPTVSVTGARGEFRRPGLVEWYVNRPAGPEHGFDVPRRPAGTGRLEVALRLRTGLDLAVAGGGRSVRFHDGGGGCVLRLDGLFAFDAHGAPLDARFERRGELLVLSVDDAGASYPVTIDPTVVNEDARLLPEGGPDRAAFGTAVALAGDRAVVGAPGDGTLAGTVYVFLRGAQGSWEVEAKLTDGLGARPGDDFGQALDYDGTRLVIGAPRATSSGPDAGRVIQFERAGAVWSRLADVVGNDTTTGDRFGHAVALDGGDLLVGAPEWDDAQGVDRGCVYAFSPSGSGWTQRNQLVGYPGLAQQEHFGSSVDVDLGWAAVGCRGRVYTLRKIGSFWSLFGQYLSPQNFTDNFGSVVLKPGPFTILVPDVGMNHGVVYEYELGQFWSEVDQIVPNDLAPGDGFGQYIAYHQGELIASSLGDHAGEPYSLYSFDDTGSGWSQNSTTGVPFRPTALALTDDRALVGGQGAGPEDSGRALVLSRSGPGWSAEAQLQGTHVDPDEDFGTALALSGDIAVVGSPGDGDTAQEAGAAYVFERNAGEWELAVKLTAGSAALRRDRFGRSVDLDDSAGALRLAVGAPGLLRRAVFVYEHTAGTWTLEDVVEPGMAPAQFAEEGALHGDLLASGEALYEWDGSAYAFAQLFPLSGTGLDAVTDVVLGPDVAVIADRGWDGAHPQQGAVWVFDRIGNGPFNLRQRLESPTPEPFAKFGAALALEGGRLAVGEPTGSRGRVAVFERDAGGTWQLSTVLSSAGEPARYLGQAVGIEGERVVAGATSKSLGGAIYVFRGTGSGWSEELVLEESATAPGDGIGGDLAVAGDRVLTSAPGDGGRGVAYVFELGEPSPFVPFCFGDGSGGGTGGGSGATCPCGNPGLAGEGCGNSSGRGSRVSASGSASVSAGDLVVHYSSDLPDKPALLFSGNAALAGPLFNDGLRCVGGAVRRHGFRHPDAGGAAAWAGLGGGFGAFVGGSVFVQAWYRDPQGPCGSGSNLTNGLEVLVAP